MSDTIRLYETYGGNCMRNWFTALVLNCLDMYNDNEYFRVLHLSKY